MTCHRLLLLALLASAGPALAQNEPFRIINGARVPATTLNIVRAGQEGWGANLLARGPLAPGDQLSMRPPEGAGCRFDLRLLLQDGQEVIRRDADVCQDRLLIVAPPAPPPSPPLPQAGDGDRPQPSVGGRN